MQYQVIRTELSSEKFPSDRPLNMNVQICSLVYGLFPRKLANDISHQFGGIFVGNPDLITLNWVAWRTLCVLRAAAMGIKGASIWSICHQQKLQHHNKNTQTTMKVLSLALLLSSLVTLSMSYPSRNEFLDSIIQALLSEDIDATSAMVRGIDRLWCLKIIAGFINFDVVVTIEVAKYVDVLRRILTPCK